MSSQVSNRRREGYLTVQNYIKIVRIDREGQSKNSPGRLEDLDVRMHPQISTADCTYRS